MPYKDAVLRRKTWAASKRNHRLHNRLYLEAVARAEPKAVEAERQRDLAQNAMRPANDLHDRIAAMPREDRQAHKAEYITVLARCQAIDRDAAQEEYLRLRAEVIAEAQLAVLLS